MNAWNLTTIEVRLRAGLRTGMLTFALIFFPARAVDGAEQEAVALPAGVHAVWDLSKAHRDTTPSRERICLNGLWHWQPSVGAGEQLPTGNWGYFKVPGSWPGITDYMQKDCQTLFVHPAWKEVRLGGVTAAWHQREMAVPEAWSGRRIALSADNLNSFALVYIDGAKAGEMRFPGGELDITDHCRPGAKHLLTMLVTAMPLKAVMLSYIDTASAREVKGSVARRGFCGDVYLVSKPSGPRIQKARAETSVRRGEIAFQVDVEQVTSEGRYLLQAKIMTAEGAVKEFRSPPFSGAELRNGQFRFTERWRPEAFWDLHTPTNMCTVQISLLDAEGKLLDASWPSRFGFRELWIQGRDFYLNGSRIFLSALPLDNAQVGAALATYTAARESLERLQSFGINFVYTHNYDCLPGSHLAFEEILRAADDVGMLVALTQPHFSHYDWASPDADRTNGYAQHAKYYADLAQNHPSVAMYSMSHNATGYNEDMNPDMIDGLTDPRDTWSARNAKTALRAEAIVKEIDPSRIVYHHASGNLGTMHPINFYPNFVPVQELSDWFGHWAAQGVKPAFLCEYGAPFTWDWTMYRGWYNGKREFGSAVVPWEFCVAEWNAQFIGDTAYRISEAEKTNLRWEAKQFAAGKLWHRWDYPHQVGSTAFEERYPIFFSYLTENWRAFRTWGVSAISPWEHGHFWKLRDGVKRGRKELPVDWQNLQRPGFSPDYIDQQYERMDLAFERGDWIATPAAEALLRNNRPLLAYISGKPERFTSKDHNFLPGQSFQKQLIVINNSRETVGCEVSWELALPKRIHGTQAVTAGPGQQERIPIEFELPGALEAGWYELKATFKFNQGEVQSDGFVIDVLARSDGDAARAERSPYHGNAGISARAERSPYLSAKIGVFDPKGETSLLLKEFGAVFQQIEAGSDFTGFDLLIIGKAALTLDDRGPDLSRVRAGSKVIVFEQTGEVLEKRLGFRVAEYGLRNAFPRIPDHPILNGLQTDHLRDWRGEATILPSKLKYQSDRRFNGAPTVEWCGIPVTRLWRCGNQGNVASVLIEKPTRGDFLPIIDGGYSLQYSPLLEYREGQGMILFCQMDVTGRTEQEPAAEILLKNLLNYVAVWKPEAPRTAVYIGEPSGKTWLESVGFKVEQADPTERRKGKVIVLGPGAAKEVNAASAVRHWHEQGEPLLAIGLDQSEAEALLPVKIAMKQGEHIAAWFDAPGHGSWLAGVSSADAHNRDPRPLNLLTGGVDLVGNGLLARSAQNHVTFCQLVPWRFEATKQMNLKRTHRRASFLVSRLLSNLGAERSAPLIERFLQPVAKEANEKRWLTGLYLDQPEEWDDPYRFFRW